MPCDCVGACTTCCGNPDAFPCSMVKNECIGCGGTWYTTGIGVGYPYVGSDPVGGEIWVDGVNTGYLTAHRLTIPIGVHTFTVKKIGYYDCSITATVLEEEHISIPCNLSLIIGSISCTSNPPGATVWLDNANKGLTTPVTIGATFGSHTITFKKAGYNDCPIPVNVEASITATAYCDLTVKVCSIDCYSTPSGARIWIDDVDQLVNTPYAITNVSVANHKIGYKLQRYVECTNFMGITDNSVLNCTLLCLPNWQCEIPLNGWEYDVNNCGSPRRLNSACNCMPNWQCRQPLDGVEHDINNCGEADRLNPACNPPTSCNCTITFG